MYAYQLVRFVRLIISQYCRWMGHIIVGAILSVAHTFD